MDRRDFLKLFAAAAVVAPVAPKYFFAPSGGWLIGVDRGSGADFTAVRITATEIVKRQEEKLLMIGQRLYVFGSEMGISRAYVSARLDPATICRTESS